MYNHQKASISELSAYFRPFKRLPADSAGNSQILNCSCHTACPLFFLNFIFRLTSIHFIIDTSKYPHDSNTRHERSRPRIRLDFQISTRNSKKNQNNGKPSRSFIICDLVTTKKYNCGAEVLLEKCSQKLAITNEHSQLSRLRSNVLATFMTQFVQMSIGTCVHCGMASNVAEQRF